MTNDYDVGKIRKLKGLEAVRERPGMYIGDVTSGNALHHCIWEVVDNSVDEHLAGHCMHIRVSLLADGSVQVEDNGRGIPVGMHPTEGKDALEVVLTDLHAGGKFDNDTYAMSAGLHGVGVSAVNAVSEWLTATVHRNGQTWLQSYAQGHPVSEVLPCGPTDLRGTVIQWKWDPAIFSGVLEYDAKRIRTRLEELAFLNPGLTIDFIDERKARVQKTYCYQAGVHEFVEMLVTKRKPVTKVFSYKAPNIEVAFVWTDSEEEVRCYANNTFNADGGTHLTGFRAGISKTLGDYIKTHGLDKGLADGVQPGDIREGLLAVVSVRVPDPSFSSQTKDKLVTPRAREMVSDLLDDQFVHFLNENPGLARKIAERAVLNARAREAARKAKDEVKRKDFMDTLSLPGKLSDCASKKPWECELFIVEGDSAGGSSKQGRDRRFQAILPLRGKVLNVEKASIESILENAEIGTLLTALGCGIENTRTFNPDKLRYHKIIIMTDADVDGAHIRTLLLTLFYRCAPRLLYEGYVYVAKPPLYGVRIGSSQKMFYCSTHEAYEEFVNGLNTESRSRLRVTRYKGLGEMNPEALWETAMDPARRTLMQVSVDDAALAEKLFYDLMGDDVKVRKAYIEQFAELATLDF